MLATTPIPANEDFHAVECHAVECMEQTRPRRGL